MANSVLLLNYTQPKGDFITFFTELNSDFKVNDRVFIVGGNYDNTTFTDKNNSLYDPFNDFATGYTITSVDNTDLSNAITLNISYRKAQYNTLGVDTTQYSPLPVYNENSIKEAYISKTYVKSGEINGGIFEDGIFGEFEKDSAIFNNRFDSDVPAQFTNGIMIGGDYQWGDFKTKYVDTKVGKKQSLNEFNGITNVLDSSKFNIQKFTNNNDGYGYSIVVGGNLGKIYDNKHDISANGTNFTITFNDYIPYPLWKSFVSTNPYKFNLQIRVVSTKNNRVFDIKSLNNNILTLENIQTYGSHIEDCILFDENGFFEIFIYVKNNTTGILNSLNSGRFFKPKVYGGVFDNGNILGGDIYWGEFKKGIYNSKYDKLNFNDGVVNGAKESTFLNDVRWNNGVFIDGNWKGSDLITIKNFTITPSFTITISKNYKQLLNINDTLMISYIKKGIGSNYLQNFTDIPNDYPLNYSEFTLTGFTETDDNKNNNQITVLLSGNANNITEETNLIYAKISQSYFDKGVWYDGVWQSGLRKIKNTRVVNFNILDQNHLQVEVETPNNILYGDFLEISNLNVDRKFTISILDNATSGLVIDNRIIDYVEPFTQTLRVVDISNNTLILHFKDLDKKFNDINIIETSYITSINKIISTKNDYTVLTPSLWISGQFNSGVWDGGIFRDGTMTSKLYFDKDNLEDQIVWKSGYHRNGSVNKMVHLSGVWENGNYVSGIISNNINNQEINDKNILSNGDSVFIDGVFGDKSNNLEFRRGLLLEGEFLGGKIINGGIENITFKGGEYTNGLGVYSNQYYNNRSGIVDQSGVYGQLSAPSVIYVDGDGWVQLDQPSFFQKDYNVIFKDFDRFQNPLNGQMFDIINRDLYGTKVQIEYSTSGNNPIYLIDEFKNLNPIISIDNLKDFTQYSEHEYYFLDSSNNRIIYLDNQSKKVDILGKIVGKVDIYNFTKLQFIDIPTKYNTFDNIDNIYIVDNNVLRRIRVIDKSIFTYNMTLNTNETIIDMKTIIQGVAKETVVMLTSQNRLLFTTLSDSKITYINSGLVNTTSISVLRKQNTSSIDLFIINGLTISHLIFDFNITTFVYSYRQTSPIVINNMISGNIISLTSYYNNTDVILYINLNNDLYRFIYSEIYTSIQNTFNILNSSVIENKLTTLKISQNFSSINSLNYDIDSPLLVNNSLLINEIRGFGDQFSNIKLLDTEQNTSSGIALKYWYYDSTTNRIIYVNEDNVNYLSTDVITIPEGNVIHKLIKGDSNNRIYAIESDKNNNYFIRRCEYGGGGSSIITINNISVIWDLIYLNGLYVLVSNQNSKISICKLTNFINNTFEYSNVAIKDSITNDITITDQSTSDNSFDIISFNNHFLCVLNLGSSLYQIEIFPTYFVNVGQIQLNNTFNHIINDVCLTNNGTSGTFSLFMATNEGIFDIHSDKYVTSAFRWSLLNDFSNKYSNTITKNISRQNNRIVFDSVSQFVVMDSNYLTNDNTIVDFTKVGNNIFSISNQRIVNSTSGVVLDGVYNMLARNGSSYPSSINDILLNNPLNIVSGTNSLLQPIIYYKDSVNTTLDSLRGYNTVTNTHYCVSYTVVNDLIKDLCFYNNYLYSYETSTTQSKFKYYTSNLATSTTFALNILPLNVLRVSMNKYLTNNYVVSYSSDGKIIITPITLPSTLSTPVLIATISDVKDISFIGNKIFLLLNNGDLNYLMYSGSSTFVTPSEWSLQNTNISNVSAISENEDKTFLEYYVNNSNKVIQLNISNIRDTNVNIVASYSFDFTSNITIAYNDSIGYNGVLLLNNIHTVNLDNLIPSISTGNFIKFIALNNTLVYALYDNGDICEFNTSLNTCKLVSKPTPSLRVPTINDLITTYTLSPTDFTLYGNKLLILYNYLSSNYYDVFEYDGVTFSKTNINWLYPTDTSNNNATYGIFNDGTTDSTIFNGITGGNKYTFSSSTKPSLSSFNGVVYFYFENDFLKLSKIDTYEIVSNTTYNDLIIKITLPFYNNTKDSVINTGIKLVDSSTNTVIATSSLVQIGSTYTIGSEIITLNSNDAIIKFPYQTNINTVFSLNIFSTILSASLYASYTSVYDFIVFDDNSGNEIVVRELITDSQFFTNSLETDFFTLLNVSSGVWSIVNTSSTSKFNIYSPLIINSGSFIDIKIGSNTFAYNNQMFSKTLSVFDDTYYFTNIVKGYKVSNEQTLSPYLTSRVLYDTVIERKVIFNRFGTTTTAHFVNSRWNNGLFVGTWSQPDYFNNNKIDGFSVFINGTFNGDFYNGFFLGGNFNNNANLITGHLSSDSYPIIFNAEVNSPYRYDVLDIKYLNNELTFNIEALSYSDNNYTNVVNDKINKNVWVKIPGLFKTIELEIFEILKNDLKNLNHDEITLVVKKPLKMNGIDLSGTNGDTFITDFLYNQKLFINSFENVNSIDSAETLFGEHIPQNVFVYDDNIYITIKNEFVDFNTEGIYVPQNKPVITLNEYFKVKRANTFIKDSKFYSDVVFDLYVPNNSYNIVQSYFKENTQVIQTGNYEGYIYFEDYIQMFNTTFNKTDKILSATINNTLENVYIKDVISDDNTSNIFINTSNDIATHDITVWNSNILSTINTYISNSIFLSGSTNINFKTGAWLNKDETGFSKGTSSFKNLNATFEGTPTKILNITFEGNEYLWIELDTIIFNVDKKRYITLRGFIGDKANVIGATVSKVYRIIEVEDNLIKIKNPFKLFEDFNKDKLGIAKQTMLLKDLTGDTVDCNNFPSINFKNNNFEQFIGTVEISNNWYYTGSLNKQTNIFNYYDNGVKITGLEYSNSGNYNTVSQKYNFIGGNKYRFKINVFSDTTASNFITLKFSLDNILIKTNTFTTIFGEETLTFEFTPSTNYYSFNIDATSVGGIHIIEDVSVETLTESIITENFYYGYASPTCFNGGDFTGIFNSVWNAGNFINGDFNGEWFGTEESYAWNGTASISTKEITNGYVITIDLPYASVEDGDYVLIEYPKIFDGQNMITTYPNQYGVILDNKFVYQTDFIIPDNVYLINLTTYRKDYLGTNTLLTDFNSNVKINDNITTHNIIDYVYDSVLGSAGYNKVIAFNNDFYINTIDYINIAHNNDITEDGFMIDLCFKKVGSQIQPILGFHNSENNFNGFKLYVNTSNVLMLEFYDKSNPQSVVVIGTISTSWNHVKIVVKDSFATTYLNGVSGNTFNITLINYDVCFIGKMLTQSSDGKITSSIFKGEMDEIRFWSKINDYVLYNGNNTSVKIVNQYITDLVAYYNFERLDNKYFPMEDQYYVLNTTTTPLRLEDENGDIYYYGKESLFCEFDFFVEKNTNISKLITFEESRQVDSNGVEMKYYLELLIQPISDTQFNLVVREKMTYNDLLVYPSYDNNYVIDYTVSDTLFATNINYYQWINIIIDDSQIFINGELIGAYKIVNRNLFKYTIKTSVIFGYYEYAKIDLITPITPTNGITGFIKGFNLWKNDLAKDNYYIYRIVSGEDISLYNDVNFSVSNNKLKSGDSNQIILPTFNSDGSNNWENYIYSDSDDFTNPINKIDINGKPLPMNFIELGLETDKLNTILPNNTWLSGTDFITLDTSSTQIPRNTPSINNDNYLLTYDDVNNVDIKIPLSNTSNFKFFNKDVNIDGNVQLSITASGFIFFEKVRINNTIQDYPLFDYVDNVTDNKFYQTSTTESIMLNNIIDIRSLAGGTGGFVQYVDREDEFVIKFYGKTTNIDVNNYNQHYYDNNKSDLDTDFSFFAIRIDKINSNILFYVRRLGESNDQKILGLRRSDGSKTVINDSSRISYNKNTDDQNDFIIGYPNTSLTNTTVSHNTEYVLFVPRFSSNSVDKSYTNFIANKDYDLISENYGLSVYKSFNASNINQYQLVTDNTLTPSYFYFNNGFIPYVPSNYTNTSYPFNEQYYGSINGYKYNNSDYETEDLVSKVSYFYGGNFNSTLWRNGVFVNGNISVNNFIWKYGIKHNGTISGDGILKDSAHWLGGYHNGNNDLSSVSDIIWYRGQFKGGKWLKGQWLSIDNNLDYCYNNCMSFNDNWSIFSGGEWYSLFNQNTNQTVINLYKDYDNGTFENSLLPSNTSSYSFNILDYTSINVKNTLGGNKFLNIVSLNTNTTTPVLNFDGQTIFTSGIIYTTKNSIYTVTAQVYIPNLNGGIKIVAKSLSNDTTKDVTNVVMIGSCKYGSAYYQDIKDGLGTPYRLNQINNGWVDISHNFNTNNNEKIVIEIQSYNVETNCNFYLDNIDIEGVDLSINIINPDKISNHDSVWHGGIWESERVDNLRYSYMATNTKQYIVNESKILELPQVKSIWLGGLWLRGEFHGGIFANGFWHSTLCEQGTSGLAYENSIGYRYDKNISTFYEGKMINSVWNGGTVDNTIDRLDIVFGDLNNLYSVQNPQIDGDFTWKNSDYFIFKKSDFVSSYSNPIFGRQLFNGFHNGLSFDGTDITNNSIEINRVRNQFNSDGVYGVYWKRGDFGNGVLQFSHFDSLGLDNVRQSIITEDESKNNSIFRKGLIYYSTWKGGLYHAISTSDVYPYNNNTEPNSLFYYSSWEMGYWKAKGFSISKTGAYSSSLDTTDDIEITNALFSRSLWSSGVFEGGSFDLSIWRSGFTGNNGTVGLSRTIEYKGTSSQLLRSDDNLAFNIDHIFNNNDYKYSTSGTNGIPFLKNDSTIISSFEDSNYRTLGSIDNMASIFVNGHMRGSVWHGGLWLRGMFQHKDYISKNFFGDSISSDDMYSLGIWTRGLWFSGYFSQYDDKNTKKYLNNNHMYNNGIIGEKGKRSLFMGIDSSSLNDATNIMGMSDVDYDTYKLDSLNGINSIHNFASVYSRRLLKDSTDVFGNLKNTKPYFNLFNGSFINGIFYQDSNDFNRMILSPFSNFGEYIKLRSGNNNVNNNIQYFNTDVKTGKSFSNILTINYNSNGVLKGSSSNIVNITDGNIINNANPIDTLNIWRHNINESFNFVSHFGDGVIVNGTNGLSFMVDPLNGRKNIQISIAQGDGMLWINDEANGEPRYHDGIGDLELNAVIYDFQNPDTPLPGGSPTQGFDNDDFFTNP